MLNFQRAKVRWAKSYIVMHWVTLPGLHLIRHSRKASPQTLMYSLGKIEDVGDKRNDLALFWDPSRRVGRTLPWGHLIPEESTGLCTTPLARGIRGSREQPKGQWAWKHPLILFRDRTSTDSSNAVLSICKKPSSSDTHAAVTMGVWKINIFSKQFPYS